MFRFPVPPKLGEVMLTYPEPTVIVDGTLVEKNSQIPNPMTTKPMIINEAKVALTVFARRPVTKANMIRTAPVTTRITSGINPKPDGGCTVNSPTLIYFTSSVLYSVYRPLFTNR